MKHIILSLASISIILYSSAQQKNTVLDLNRSTILIYKQTKPNNSLVPHGVGFFLYNYSTTDPRIGYPMATCKHLTYADTLVLAVPTTDSLKHLLRKNKQTVFQAHDPIGFSVFYDFDGTNFLYKIPLKIDSNLFRHPSLDLAIIFANPPSLILQENQSLIRLTNLVAIPSSAIANNDEIIPGSDAVFIGFPFGIGSKSGFRNSNLYRDEKVNALFRRGLISWVSESSSDFLMDGFSFGGNSGSPIFSTISFSNTTSKLLGMVTGHLNDPMNIISVDTLTGMSKATNLYATPNNGLAQCIPSTVIFDFSKEAIQNKIKQLKAFNR